ncbi:hypothetical protein TNCV_2165851 [Trichonephila clavipes]|nr:hypothetical protein TNCV_2165851 [Trichonephila clavipes]
MQQLDANSYMLQFQQQQQFRRFRDSVFSICRYLQALFFKMPQKRKSSLSENSSRARAAKVARNQESSVHAELRRQQQAQRQSILRAAETPLQARVLSETQAELQAARKAIETPEQSQARKNS